MVVSLTAVFQVQSCKRRIPSSTHQRLFRAGSEWGNSRAGYFREGRSPCIEYLFGLIENEQEKAANKKAKYKLVHLGRHGNTIALKSDEVFVVLINTSKW